MTTYSDYGGYTRVWRPVSIADADRPGISWSRRLQAQDMLDEMTFAYQKAAVSCALGRPAKDSDVTLPPQRAPLHAQYPAFPAARSCVGLSAIAQYTAHMKEPRKWLSIPASDRDLTNKNVDPQAFKQTRCHIIKAVGNRICLDHLRLFADMPAVESYRLFAAAILDYRFPRLKDLLLAACVMGDLVFALLARDRMRKKLHPLSWRILKSLAPALRRYEDNLLECRECELPNFGARLADEMMEAVLPFLPPKLPEESRNADLESVLPTDLKRKLRQSLGKVPTRKRQEPPPGEDILSQPLQGMDEVTPPALDEPNNTLQVRPKEVARETDRLPTPRATSPEQQQVQKMLQHASAVVAQSTSGEAWHDPRVDQVTDAIRRSLFEPGAVEVELASRRKKVKVFGSEQEGMISEEVLSRCKNRDALARIRRGADPICGKLLQFRWFGERDEMQVDRFQVRGPLDPQRLYKIGVSELLYRCWRKQRVTDFRGRPVVVLAKDGSSSNSLETTFAGQILTAAFLRIERIARIQVIAADYSSGPGGSPLVRWLYHPRKTPGLIPSRAVDAVASLPPKGQGGNKDVLSVSHILRETLAAVDRKQSIIVINITDGIFNSPVDHVRAMVKKLKTDHNLIYSFVVLGERKIDIPEADHTMRIPQSELSDSKQIAERIARHVNTLVLAQRNKGRKYRA